MTHIIESDASIVIRELNGSFILSLLAHVMEEIQSLLISFGGGLCCVVLRSTNRVIHSLASSLSMSGRNKVWVNCYPILFIINNLDKIWVLLLDRIIHMSAIFIGKIHATNKDLFEYKKIKKNCTAYLSIIAHLNNFIKITFKF